ncbi:thioredoxin domain protein [Pelomyxa schiedti]|nr:thioredoxin domain protein [Pelomyxa schiedti]
MATTTAASSAAASSDPTVVTTAAATATDNKNRNKLSASRSPYLQQHANNPVWWWEWCDEVFEEARRRDCPVLLSIGYSTCHWCHVMAHESFENSSIATLMNNNFVNIKVDREEHPDIDSVYMGACQAMTGHGGWPLTIIMTPDKKPFFAGTYLPPHSRFGQMGFVELMEKVSTLWNTRRDDLIGNANTVCDALREIESDLQESAEVTTEPLHKALANLKSSFDSHYGGFGHAPKFPTPHTLCLCLRLYGRERSPQALQMLEHTLRRMRHGGIYDHLGFGFHRYSTDNKWRVPHFEKMLYDQATTLMAYTEAFQATGNEFYAETAREIITYVTNYLQSPEGVFYSAEDADSEGVEGKFYVWRADEIQELLGKDADIFMQCYHIKPAGNFEHGENILYSNSDAHLEKVAKGASLPMKELNSILQRCRQQLLAVRDTRVRPHRDNKILTDWNALWIGAVAKAARALNSSHYANIASKAAAFFLSKMYTGGKLFHRYMNGESGITGILDDYAFLGWALAELYQTTLDDSTLFSCREICQEMLRLFWDSNKGGLFFTSIGHEEFLVRKKEVSDGAIPSGNSMALLTLLHLSELTGDVSFEKLAHELAMSYAGLVLKSPSGFSQLLIGYDALIGPRARVIVGANTAQEANNALQPLFQRFYPKLYVGYNSKAEILDSSTHGMHPSDQGTPMFYTCVGTECHPPSLSINDVIAFFD